MSKTIWKYELKVTEDQYVLMPEHSKILDLQVRDDVPHLWAEIDTDAMTYSRFFSIFKTGQYMKTYEGWKREYVGTFCLRGGHHSFHVYEDIEVEK
jgi:hypothetical protein